VIGAGVTSLHPGAATFAYSSNSASAARATQIEKGEGAVGVAPLAGSARREGEKTGRLARRASRTGGGVGTIAGATRPPIEEDENVMVRSRRLAQTGKDRGAGRRALPRRALPAQFQSAAPQEHAGFPIAEQLIYSRPSPAQAALG
jgi:hypothetical protein